MGKPRPLVAKHAIAVGRRIIQPIDSRMLRERVVMSNDPAVKGREHLFIDLYDALEGPQPHERAVAIPVGETRASEPPAEKPLSKMNKKELLAAAGAAGIEADESMTNKRIRNLLEGQ